LMSQGYFFIFLMLCESSHINLTEIACFSDVHKKIQDPICFVAFITKVCVAALLAVLMTGN